MPKTVNRELVSKAWQLKHEGKTQAYIAEQLHSSLAQIQRYLSPSWLMERELQHLQFAPLPERRPSTPLQWEAWKLCQDSNHSWMIPSNEYQGQAFSFTSYEEKEQETAQDPPEEQLRPIVRETYTCYFCGYTSVVRRAAMF